MKVVYPNKGYVLAKKLGDRHAVGLCTINGLWDNSKEVKISETGVIFRTRLLFELPEIGF